ncbi:MAG: hypothetical protein WA395_01660 [Nitrososphaeraceae archaeon]
MTKSNNESAMLFKPFLIAGIIILAFGIVCILIGSNFISIREEADGFKIIGLRFLAGGAISISLGFIAKHFLLIKYLWKQRIWSRNRSEESNFSNWYRP